MSDEAERPLTGEESEFIQVKAKPRSSLASLLGEMKSPLNKPSELLKCISRRCNFYSLKDPIEFNNGNPPDVCQVMASLHDEEKYTNIGHNKTVKRITQNFIKDYIYLVIVDVPGQFHESFTRKDLRAHSSSQMVQKWQYPS